MAQRICSVPGCGRSAQDRGWCHGHYRRWRLNGDVDAERPLERRRYGSVLNRIADRVIVGDACWEWLGMHDHNGYSKMREPGTRRMVAVHRVMYEQYVGPIPEGRELDHLCRNRGCVRPDHLEPVTHRENMLRGATVVAVNAQATHCKYGHEFTPENTYWRPDGDRDCKACRARRLRELRARKR